MSMNLLPNKATSKGSFRPDPLGEDEEGVEEWVAGGNFTQLAMVQRKQDKAEEGQAHKEASREEEPAQKQSRETKLFSPAVWHGAWDPAWQGSNPTPSTKGHTKKHGLLETHP
jgi:hypothetical protein